MGELAPWLALCLTTVVRPVVLTVAGSDSSGGAGIQADVQVLAGHGCHPATVVTAITVQNSLGVHQSAVTDGALIQAQLQAVLTDLQPRAIKSGMLGSAAAVRALAGGLAKAGVNQPPYVCDPVLAATSGAMLLDAEGQRALKRELLPLATVITPNVPELVALLDTTVPIRTLQDAVDAGKALLTRVGCRAVLVKGGHLEQAQGTDVLVWHRSASPFADGVAAHGAIGDDTAAMATAQAWTPTYGQPEVLVLPGALVPKAVHTHGSGCVYAAALAARLARGESIRQAASGAKAWMNGAIAQGYSVGEGARTGHGSGCVHPCPDPSRPAPQPVGAAASRWTRRGQLHVITDVTIQTRYRHEDIAAMAAQAGADVVQLRDKRQLSARARMAVAAAMVQAVAGTSTRVVVNDRLDVALAASAHGVHLGQNDLPIEAARQALAYLAKGVAHVANSAGTDTAAATGDQARTLQPWFGVGATANTPSQAREAQAQGATYLGVGPVLATKHKANPAAVLGWDGLARVAQAVDIPVIAIGGLHPQHVAAAMDAGAHGVAVLGSVLLADDPVQVLAELRQALDQSSQSSMFHPQQVVA